MSWPLDFPNDNDLSHITVKTEIRASTTASTSPADYYTYEYVHIPIFVWCVIAVILVWMGHYVIREFNLRWHKPLK